VDSRRLYVTPGAKTIGRVISRPNIAGVEPAGRFTLSHAVLAAPRVARKKRCGNWIICISVSGFAPTGLLVLEMNHWKRLSIRDLAGTLELDAGETFRQKRVPFRDLRPIAAFTC
jgi:hypothetical protein